MAFETVYGQPVARQILATALSSGRISHAYLFVGPDGTGKSVLAVEFARALICAATLEHPDLLIVEPDGSSLRIDQARRIQKELSLSPVAARVRVAIIKHVDKMTLEAANSLLKILEDPPATSVLILIASNINLVLPTVVSRCQIVPFRPSPLADVEAFLLSQGTEPKRAKALSALSGGIAGKAVALASGEGEGKTRRVAVHCVENLKSLDPWTLAAQFPQDRSEVLDVLLFIASVFRDAIVASAGLPDYVLVNLDMIDTVRRLSEYGVETLRRCVEEIAAARRRVERNCNIACSLELMFIKLNNNLKT